MNLTTMKSLFKDVYGRPLLLIKKNLKKHLKMTVPKCGDFKLFVRDTTDVAYVKPLLNLQEWTDVDRLTHLFVIGDRFTYDDAKSMFLYLYDRKDFPFEESDFPQYFRKYGLWTRKEKPDSFPYFQYTEENMSRFLRTYKEKHLPTALDYPPQPVHKNTIATFEKWQKSDLTDDEDEANFQLSHSGGFGNCNWDESRSVVSVDNEQSLIEDINFEKRGSGSSSNGNGGTVIELSQDVCLGARDPPFSDDDTKQVVDTTSRPVTPSKRKVAAFVDCAEEQTVRGSKRHRSH